MRPMSRDNSVERCDTSCKSAIKKCLHYSLLFVIIQDDLPAYARTVLCVFMRTVL